MHLEATRCAGEARARLQRSDTHDSAALERLLRERSPPTERDRTVTPFAGPLAPARDSRSARSMTCASKPRTLDAGTKVACGSGTMFTQQPFSRSFSQSAFALTALAAWLNTTAANAQESPAPPQSAAPTYAIPAGCTLGKDANDADVIVCPSTPVMMPDSAGTALGTQPSVMARKKEWYGWQTLMADGGALLLGVAAGGSKSDGLGVFAYGTYLLGPGLIHMAHGNYGVGGGSMGIRLLAPPVGAVLGLALGAASCRSRNLGFDRGNSACILGNTVVGGLVGYVAAVVLDAALFSYERPSPTPVAGSAKRKPKATVVPTGNFTTESAQVGLAGSF
jgi:hypothetical protein